MNWRRLIVFVGCAALVGCGRATLRRDSTTDSVTAEVSGRMDSRVSSAGEPHPAPPAGTSTDDGLCEAEAVATALWNNPRFAETLSELGFARADLVQAGLLSNPVLAVLFPLGPKQLEFVVTAPIEALWLRPRRLAVAQSEYDRLAAQLVQSGLDLARDVRVAFAEVHLADELVRLSDDGLRVQESLAELTEARLRAGEIGELEVSAAQAEVARAREQASRAAYDRRVALVRLHAALGIVEAGSEFKLAPPMPLPDSLPAVPELIELALADGPICEPPNMPSNSRANEPAWLAPNF